MSRAVLTHLSIACAAIVWFAAPAVVVAQSPAEQPEAVRGKIYALYGLDKGTR